MQNEWSIDSAESGVLIKSKHSLIGYMPGDRNNFKGRVAIENDQLEDASIEFSLKLNDKGIYSNSENTEPKFLELFNQNESEVIEFKSTSFQKISKNLNFLKGFLTIKNVTKVVELDTEFIGYSNYGGVEKASFEITGNFSRKDFGLSRSRSYHAASPMSKDLKLIANLEFTH